MSAALGSSSVDDVFTDPFPGDVTTATAATTATTVDGAVETRIDSDGVLTTITLATPTPTLTVDGPTAPSGSVSFNTNAGIPTSTKVAFPPSATDASTTSSPQPDSASQQSNGNAGGLSQSAKIGLGVGLGVGIPLLLAVMAFLFMRRRKRQTRGQISPKYEVQGQSDLSMIETPHPHGMSASREPLHPSHDESMKHLDTQQYQAYQPPPPPPINTFADGDVFQTPVSAVTRSELQSSPSDERPMSRHIPGGAPVVTIPGPGSTSLHSRDASIDGGISPVSPVSPVSAMSPVRSRAPSPRP